jgi:predicted esterase
VAGDVTGRSAGEAPVSVHHLTVARTARYATVGADPAEATWLWVAFHGYAHRAADFVAPFAEAAPPGVRVVAPEGLSRFYLELPRPDGGHLERTGASWLTRDDREHELADALAMVQAVVAREHAAIRHARGALPQLAVLGFSQGVAMSQRWAAVLRENPSLGRDAVLQRHVLWAGGLAHDVSNEALHAAWQGTTVTAVWGTRDRFATEAAQAAAARRLAQVGVTPQVRTFAGGHRIDAPLLAALLSDRP